MDRINKVHALCWNGCVKIKTCSDCVWFEWDENRKKCSNQETVICHIYRKRLYRELKDGVSIP